jgi:DNA-binding NtrC family response regulator/PAS domain-containing protein
MVGLVELDLPYNVWWPVVGLRWCEFLYTLNMGLQAHSNSMEQNSPTIASLAKLLDESSRPIYAIDARREIAYCNQALADWLGLEPRRIVGRLVEYHSEPADEGGLRRASAGLLADLCPPPQALAGEPCSGTVACVDRDGRLVHRLAEFVPLVTGDLAAGRGDGTVSDGQPRCGVLVLLAAADMSSQELSAELSGEPTGDELHRAIRRFRRNLAGEYAIETLLGVSSGMRKVRAQVAAAAVSSVNVLVRGRRGSGRAHVARAIHYQGVAEGDSRLVPFDCAVASEDLLRRTLDALRSDGTAKRRATLLVENVERLAPTLQSQLLPAITSLPAGVRVVATMVTDSPPTHAEASEPADAASVVHPQLLDALSTITIDVPPLASRPEDLPLVAQCFLEACNRRSSKQVGSIHPDALDLLALCRWPGELDELRDAIAAAHAAAMTHEITPADLSAVVHHAAKAAALPRRATEKIVLDELLSSIEREVITRALAQAGGNKSAAAELLGMTRPRLYRRLVQLGLVEIDEGD